MNLRPEWATLLFLLLFAGCPSPGIAAPPTNDDFESATVISGMAATVTGTNVEATRQPGEPTSPEGYDRASVWWKWTAPSPGWFEINTLGSTFDTGLSVFTGTGLDALGRVKYHDGTLSIPQSRLRFEAAAGTVYYIQVQGWFGASGDIQLEVKSAQPPQPATLQTFILSPTTLNLDDGPMASGLECAFTAPDGLESITVVLTGPRGDVVRYANPMRDVQMVAGDVRAGTFRTPVYGDHGLVTSDGGPSHAFGEWSVSVILTDLYGESIHFGGMGHSPLPAGSQSTLTIRTDHPLNLAPPVVLTGSITPATVDVTDEPAVLQAEVTVTDDAGMPFYDFCLLDLVNPQGNIIASAVWSGVTGTSTHKTLTGTITVPRHTAAGSYIL